MAKVKVYSRLASGIKFNFTKYIGSAKRGNLVVSDPDPDEVIVINGTNQVLNNARIIVPHVATIFTDEMDRDPEKGIYTLDDLERLKKDETFKRCLASGDMSIDTTADLSHDLTGGGLLTTQELDERAKKAAAKVGNPEVDTMAKLATIAH